MQGLGVFSFVPVSLFCPVAGVDIPSFQTVK